MRPSVFLLTAALAAGTFAEAHAQSWLAGGPGPLVIGVGPAGRIVIGGEASATAGAPEDTGFFNYTDYEQSTLRTARIALAARWQMGVRVAVLADVRSDNLSTPTPYALYVRLHPAPALPFDVQAGRIPPVFGRFARQAYAADNPVIGAPLAYQYLTALRADAVPAAPTDLLRMRGRGWRASYPVGSAAPAPGLPVVNALRYDTGVQARYAPGVVEFAASVTAGTLANPLVRDDNRGRQVAFRAAVQPMPGLVAGISGASGAWLSSQVATTEGGERQRAFGVDVEVARGHWRLRGEIMRSHWRLPAIEAPLTATAAFVEARARVRPRLFVAARVDRLVFSRLGTGSVEWDAPVTRVEAGGGWYFHRQLIAKAVWQHNWRDGGRVRRQGFLAAQLLFWF